MQQEYGGQGGVRGVNVLKTPQRGRMNVKSKVSFVQKHSLFSLSDSLEQVGFVGNASDIVPFFEALRVAEVIDMMKNVPEDEKAKQQAGVEPPSGPKR